MRRGTILVALLGLAACRQSATTPPAARTPALSVDQVLYDVAHVITVDGVRRARVEGDSAYVEDEGRQLRLFRVRLEFYDSVGKVQGRLQARMADYNVPTGLMHAQGAVTLRTPGPRGLRVLRSEELYYDPRRGELWTERAFVWTDGPSTLTGTRFRSDVRFENVTVERARTRGGLPGGATIRF